MKVEGSEPVEGTETLGYTAASQVPGKVDRTVETIQVAGAGDIVLAEDMEQDH